MTRRVNVAFHGGDRIKMKHWLNTHLSPPSREVISFVPLRGLIWVFTQRVNTHMLRFNPDYS